MIATHVVSDIEFISKEILLMKNGRLIDKASPEQLQAKIQGKVFEMSVDHHDLHKIKKKNPPLVRPMKPHMREIYRRLKAELPNTRLLVLLPFLIDTMPEKAPFHKILDEYRQVLADMAQDSGAEIIDLQAVFYDAEQQIPPAKLAVDGVHPTNLGHKIIADEILKVLK